MLVVFGRPADASWPAAVCRFQLDQPAHGGRLVATPGHRHSVSRWRGSWSWTSYALRQTAATSERDERLLVADRPEPASTVRQTRELERQTAAGQWASAGTAEHHEHPLSSTSTATSRGYVRCFRSGGGDSPHDGNPRCVTCHPPVVGDRCSASRLIRAPPTSEPHSVAATPAEPQVWSTPDSLASPPGTVERSRKATLRSRQ